MLKSKYVFPKFEIEQFKDRSYMTLTYVTKKKPFNRIMKYDFISSYTFCNMTTYRSTSPVAYNNLASDR